MILVVLGEPTGAMMSDDMGTFRVDVEIENPARPGTRTEIRNVLVDTGAELSWLPATVLDSLGIVRREQARFRQAAGTVVTRWTGAAALYVSGAWTNDKVVFAEPGDLALLGAHSLEGMNFRIDPVHKVLIDAGPAPAAAIAFAGLAALRLWRAASSSG